MPGAVVAGWRGVFVACCSGCGAVVVVSTLGAVVVVGA
ncbi:hypothetical protein FHU29_004680 [Hoyosella altamirensis]|uniref:Uncharacterized protein n=1 Tax=Hoyosella altamirensis TaxID=616997 RepID=A0A839RTH8_9ACTN|nr:hypothetical protein [Hoyosella altamirensis]